MGVWQPLTAPLKRSNFDATGPKQPVLALEAFRRKSSTAKQLDAVMLYADKSMWVEIKFAILSQYCCNHPLAAGIAQRLSLSSITFYEK